MAVYTCKYCGHQSPSSTLAGGSCSKSPTKRHVLMNATEKLKQYICIHCGHKSPSSTLAGSSCSKSPHKYHELLG